MDTLPWTASGIAKERLDAFLKEKLAGSWDTEAWEFYTWLLERAKAHRIDTSGYRSFEYQDDEAAAAQNYRLAHPEHFVTPRPKAKRSSGKLRGQPAKTRLLLIDSHSQ